MLNKKFNLTSAAPFVFMDAITKTNTPRQVNLALCF